MLNNVNMQTRPYVARGFPVTNLTSPSPAATRRKHQQHRPASDALCIWTEREGPLLRSCRMERTTPGSRDAKAIQRWHGAAYSRADSDRERSHSHIRRHSARNGIENRPRLWRRRRNVEIDDLLSSNLNARIWTSRLSRAPCYDASSPAGGLCSRS